MSEIEEALHERAQWIVRALAEWRARRRDVMPREWKSGAPILYRGRELALEVFPSRARAHRAGPVQPHGPASAARRTSRKSRQLVGTLAARRGVARWSRRAPRVYAQTLARSAPALRLSNARSEWGSCNARGEIRLNWRLVQLPPALAEYVVAHEVAHLVELNHSPRFWALVEALMPGHAALRRELEDWTALLAA